jgi:hypothetical protein
MTAARELVNRRHTQLFAEGAWHTVDRVFEGDGLIAVLVDGVADGGFWFEPDHEVRVRGTPHGS